MKIYLKKISHKNEYNFVQIVYKTIRIEDECSHINKFPIKLTSGQEDDSRIEVLDDKLNSDNTKDNDFYLCLIFNSMIDDGDYNMDDEYEPFYKEESTYVPINYCPICGDKIELIIEETLDATNEYFEIFNEIKLLSKYKRKKDEKRLRELYDKLYYYKYSEL